MDELTRFARRLVEQLSASKDGVNRAVAVGLVREKILPYRTHRRALMLDSVEDYETVLLRLIAGERGFVRTLPASVARRCQEELAGANPDLGVLDEVADSTIQITSLAAAQILGDEGDNVTLSEAKGPLSTERPAPSVAPLPQGDDRTEAKQSRRTAEIASVPAALRDDRPQVIASEAKPSRRTAEIASVPAVTLSEAKGPISKERPAPSVDSLPQGDGACPHCRHAMPSGRQVVFCPWCGGRLIPFTCPRCQTELDSEWRHCITCGAPVKDPYRFT